MSRSPPDEVDVSLERCADSLARIANTLEELSKPGATFSSDDWEAERLRKILAVALPCVERDAEETQDEEFREARKAIAQSIRDELLRYPQDDEDGS